MNYFAFDRKKMLKSLIAFIKDFDVSRTRMQYSVELCVPCSVLVRRTRRSENNLSDKRRSKVERSTVC